MTLLAPFHDGVDRFEIRSPGLDVHKHSTLADYNAQLDPAVFPRLTKITCIRNPWDRCVSFFFSPHRGEVSWSPEAFAEFIATTVKPHRHYLSLENGEEDCFRDIDIVLRFEHLRKDFSALCDRLGIGAHELPLANASKRDYYRHYYMNDTLVDLVSEKFADEIARFGYSF